MEEDDDDDDDDDDDLLDHCPVRVHYCQKLE